MAPVHYQTGKNDLLDTYLSFIENLKNTDLQDEEGVENTFFLELGEFFVEHDVKMNDIHLLADATDNLIKAFNSILNHLKDSS